MKTYPQRGLVGRWRDAIWVAAAPYRKRYGADRPAVGEVVEPLLPVKRLDEALHGRLLLAIRAFDQACADQDPDRIATAGAALVAAWKEVTAAIEARHPPEEENQSHGSVEPPHSAGREGAAALRGGALPRI
jgi:hypothetical protein